MFSSKNSKKKHDINVFFNVKYTHIHVCVLSDKVFKKICEPICIPG